ncbi:myelin and lymphocyte protein-like [Betta splendens]|uniref:Myelin and lymphocyte protein n=1 Tax=Betta splendens TaxID=158456 RepID=A0A6P7KT23_BETSP|nr:myelin and lymphocyte protein-like [Betta splendens]
MAAVTSADVLPTGCRIFTSIPDIFFIPEFVFGGLVWTLVASTYVFPANPMGWVMFVSIFCFLGTTLWFFIFLCGGNTGSIWSSLDVAFHFVAAVFYLSSSVVLAVITISFGFTVSSGVPGLPTNYNQLYQLDIAAVVMSFVATLLYFLHAIFSAIRWKRS